MKTLIDDGEFLAWDNSNPPQLWVWIGERDESAEPVRRLDVPAVPGLQELREDLEQKTKQLHRIRDILSFGTGNNGDKIEAIEKVVPAILCGEPDLSAGELFAATCNRVARDIPEAWIITIELSRNSGTIGLTDPFGDEVEFPSNHENFGDQLNNALEYALDNDIKYADENKGSE